MLAAQALYKLTRNLTAAIGSMGLSSEGFGRAALVKESALQSEVIFQGYAKAKPSKEDAYWAARSFLRGENLDAWQRDLIASAFAEPVREQAGATVLGSKRLPALLGAYEEEAKRGELWRLTWHGLLYSYFNFDPMRAKDDAEQQGLSLLRSFLERTWPVIERQSGNDVVPDWVNVLRAESQVLSNKPADKYARAYLRGDTAAIDSLAADLGIPPSSWFWHALVLGVVKSASAENDVDFKRHIPQLLNLIEGKPLFRDEALEVILIRYHACKSAQQDEYLRDFICQPTVWKNPKLKAAGIATAWNRVPDPVWHMVLSWVNERNLKDFFDILAARNKADEGRLAFWSNYMKQITWTRLVFGADTMALKRSNPAVRELIAREEGAYAQLTGRREVDAFMMQIGPHLVIEYSKKPNACYVYEADKLAFGRYEKYYDGGTEDLAVGFQTGCAARIVHTPGWQARAENELRALGIYPDAPGNSVGAVRVVKSPGPVAAVPLRQPMAPAKPAVHPVIAKHQPHTAGGPNMVTLKAVVDSFPGARIDDRRRNASGGRLWVEDPSQRVKLTNELKHMGFKWAPSRAAWYFPEN